ncbi:integral membrane protein Pth11 [Aspergillus fumigatus]|nr:integral membrane protein Pth11 [Aspergillus fumigatus]
MAFSKFSILFQYLRIFPSRRFRFACHTVMGIVALYSTWAIVSAFVNCIPVARFWDRDIPGSCLSFEAVWFFNASMNIATDLTLLIMPMPLISQLQLPRMQKIALMAVFAVGLLVVITSILRLSSLRAVAQNPDTSYSNVGAAYWTAAECNVAIICACLPFLRPLISRIFPRLLSTKSYNKYTGQPTMGTANRTRRTQLFSQDRDYGLYTIDIEATDMKRGSTGGIEVTTEMTVQELSQHDESTSQRRLVMQ